MKKLIYLCAFCLVAFAVATCDSDSKFADPSENIYDALLMDKAAQPEAVAKCDVPPCSEETAWAFGPRYVNKGNWATYTPYSGEAIYVPIYAGQNMYIGDAYIGPYKGLVRIKIRLFSGWCLQAVEEPVKIEAYEGSVILENRNPKVGVFRFKYNPVLIPGVWNIIDNDFPVASNYGIHLDVGCCD